MICLNKIERDFLLIQKKRHLLVLNTDLLHLKEDMEHYRCVNAQIYLVLNRRL